MRKEKVVYVRVSDELHERLSTLAAKKGDIQRIAAQGIKCIVDELEAERGLGASHSDSYRSKPAGSHAGYGDNRSSML